MAKSLLSINQKLFLNFVNDEKLIYNFFYLTGGTALSEFYFHHRYSEDLDFFSEKEFEVKDIMLLINSKKNFFNNPKIEYKQSFNRNIFQFIFKNNSLFDVAIDYIQLGANLLKSTTFLDDPILKKKIDKNLINDFFIEKAQELKKMILK